MNKKELTDAMARLAKSGTFEKIAPFHASNTASGSTFLTATDKDGNSRFLKLYPAGTHDACQTEVQNSLAFHAALQKLGSSVAKISDVNELMTIDGKYLAHIQEFLPGCTLDEAVLQNRHFTQEESLILHDAFMDFSRLFDSVPYCHRDVCPKNFIFTGSKLVLADFFTAIPKEYPKVINPSTKQLSFIFSLGAGFNPERGTWNDAHSLLLTFRAISPLLSLDDAVKSKLDAFLQNAAEKTTTLRPVYSVDDNWKKKMRPVYLKLLLRPLWLAKKSSREKRRAIRTTIATLLSHNQTNV